MCGFAGFYLNCETETRNSIKKNISLMTNSLEHRGPDDFGIWIDANDHLALGHRRLSILDISQSGHQPMTSLNKKYVIAFNGEIYNHIKLRNELETIKTDLKWDGHSDTETLLVCFEVWGIEKTLSKIVGMFAIALWDIKNKRLHLIRDRFGEKPLYYGWINIGNKKIFAFGSELKALRSYEGFQNNISRDALKQFFKYKYVPAPYSIYEGIYKLEPGCILSVSEIPLEEPRDLFHFKDKYIISYKGIKITKWYKFRDIVLKNTNNEIKNESEAVGLLESQLQETINMQSIADVPLGAFLSGGVDSSAIVALMQDQSSIPIKTFTIGFEESEFDESKFAKSVATFLGTEHYEMNVTSKDALSLIPDLPKLYDEPFADSSQIPTYFVSKAAKKEVSVALSGDAGDELFGGYNRYLIAPALWKKINFIPLPFRKFITSSVGRISLDSWDWIGKAHNLIRSELNGISHLGDKIYKTTSRLHNVNSIDELYKSLVSEWQNTDMLVKDDSKYSSSLINLIDDPFPNDIFDSAESRMMYWDTISYLPDDILCKIDRASMANSLETRVPFLDHRVVELSHRIPLKFKIKKNIGKVVLRNILYKHVPKELIDRPKVGFGIPLGNWLRGPLRDWVEELINIDRLDREGFLNSKIVNQIWKEHLSGKRDWSDRVWSIIIFQQWLESLEN